MSAAGAMQWARTRRMSLHTGPLRRHTARILPCERARRHVQRRRGSAPRGAGPRLDGHQRGRRGQQQVQAGGQQLVAEQPRGVQHALQEVRQHLRAPPRPRACRQGALMCMLLRHVKVAGVRLWNTPMSGLLLPRTLGTHNLVAVIPGA